jgi:hypothetical protein
MTRPRSRASAKKAGASFETAIAAYLAEHVDDRIERRTRNGTKDRGDISGLRGLFGGRLVVEVKNTARINLAGWTAEAEVERGNDAAMAGLVVHKRHGVGDPARQWVTCTLADLVALLTGERPLSVDELAEIDDDVRAERTADAADRPEENPHG